jgi:DNA-binding transcriptional LysR family regulator
MMNPNPKISLEQWRALVAVVDAGSYAKAAAVLHKSQSSLTYLVQKLESLLGVKAFEIRGRKADLTPVGQLLYRRGKLLLQEAQGLERAAKKISAGWEPQLGLAVEVLFPVWLILQCLDEFGAESPQTHIELIESVMGGTSEALLEGEAQLAILASIPQGFSGDPLMRLRMMLVASPKHPLHGLGRPVTMRDLRAHRQLIVRESGVRRATPLQIEASQRWTVTNMATAIGAACRGYGYSWFPEDKIRPELAEGSLQALPLEQGGERFGQLYLVFADRDAAGPGTVRLAEIIRKRVAEACAGR